MFFDLDGIRIETIVDLDGLREGFRDLRRFVDRQRPIDLKINIDPRDFQRALDRAARRAEVDVRVNPRGRGTLAGARGGAAGAAAGAALGAGSVATGVGAANIAGRAVRGVRRDLGDLRGRVGGIRLPDRGRGARRAEEENINIDQDSLPAATAAQRRQALDNANALFKANEKLADSNKGVTASSKTATAAVGGLALKFGAATAAAGALVSVLVTRALFNFAKDSVFAADEVAKLGIQLEVLLQSQESANQALEQFQELAGRLPFSLQEIGNAGGVLAAVADQDVGRLNELIQISANIAAVTGLSLEAASSNLQRALSAGLGAADLFREKGIGLLLEEMSEFNDVVSQTGDELFTTFQAVFGRQGPLGDATDKLFETVEGQLSRVSDAFFNLQVAVGEGIIDTGVLQGVIDDLVNTLSDPDFVVSVTESFVGLAVVLQNDVLPGLKSVAGFFTDIADQFSRRSIIGRAEDLEQDVAQARELLDVLNQAQETGRLPGRLFVPESVSDVLEDSNLNTFDGRFEAGAILADEINRLEEALEEARRQARLAAEGAPLSEILGDSAELRELFNNIAELRKESERDTAQEISRLRAESLEALEESEVSVAKEIDEAKRRIEENFIADTERISNRAQRDADARAARSARSTSEEQKRALEDLADFAAQIQQDALTERERIEQEFNEQIQSARELEAILRAQGEIEAAEEVASQREEIEQELQKRLTELQKEATDARIADQLRLTEALTEAFEEIEALEDQRRSVVQRAIDDLRQEQRLEFRVRVDGIGANTRREVRDAIIDLQDELAGVIEELATTGIDETERINDLIEDIRQLERRIENQTDLLRDFDAPRDRFVDTRFDDARDAFADLGNERADSLRRQADPGVGGILPRIQADLIEFPGDFSANLLENTRDALQTGIAEGIKAAIASGSIEDFTETLGATLTTALINAVAEALAAQAVDATIGFALSVASSIASLGTSATAPSPGSGGSGTFGQSNAATITVARGGRITSLGQALKFAQGGFVPDLNNRPFADSVPALLTPGERILSREEVRRDDTGENGGNFNITINTQSLDPSRAADVVLAQVPQIEQAMVSRINSNSDLRRAVNRARG